MQVIDSSDGAAQFINSTDSQNAHNTLTDIPSDGSQVRQNCTLAKRRQLLCQPEKPDKIVVKKVEADGQSQSDFWVLPEEIIKTGSSI